jgi:starch synthase (maltosyl-transferring)
LVLQAPDGTIKYAENPPKKYQDVYPMNYHNADWRTLWSELASVIEFWCEHGVACFAWTIRTRSLWRFGNT